MTEEQKDRQKEIWKDNPPPQCVGDCHIIDGVCCSQCQNCSWDDYGLTHESREEINNLKTDKENGNARAN